MIDTIYVIVLIVSFGLCSLFSMSLERM